MKTQGPPAERGRVKEEESVPSGGDQAGKFRRLAKSVLNVSREELERAEKAERRKKKRD